MRVELIRKCPLDRRLFAVALLSLGFSGCTLFTGRAIHYESSAEATQSISIGNAREIQVVSACSAITLERAPWVERIELRVSGTYSIQGYYGTPENARAVPLLAADLAFRVVEESGIVRLESPEYGYIHHALGIDELRLVAPNGLRVSFLCLTLEEVERRRSPKPEPSGS